MARSRPMATTAALLGVAMLVATLTTGCGDEPSAQLGSEAAADSTIEPGPTGGDRLDAGADLESDDAGAGTNNAAAGPGDPVDLGQPFAPEPGPLTDDNLPATFLAVALGTYEVVEVSTVDGSVVRSLGSTGGDPTRTDVEIADNVIDGAWWHPATGIALAAEGPEPAAGTIWRLDPGEVVSSEGGLEAWFSNGWEAAISPNGRWALVTGYGAWLSALDGDRSGPGVDLVDLVDNGDGYFRYDPAWLRDRVGVAVVRDGEQGANVVDVIELGPDGVVTSTVSHPMPEVVIDLEVRGDGKLVVLLADATESGSRGDGGGGLGPVGGSAARIVDPDTGAVDAEFDLEPGSHSLAYDTTGTTLLYVDGEGTVRWRGRGRAGVLADGYLHADW